MNTNELRNLVIETIYDGISEDCSESKSADDYKEHGLSMDDYYELYEEFCRKHFKPEPQQTRQELETTNDAFVLAFQSHKKGFVLGFKVAMLLSHSITDIHNKKCIA